jgi:hypothetical protein
MAIIDALSGADTTEALAWLPPLVMPLTGAVWHPLALRLVRRT